MEPASKNSNFPKRTIGIYKGQDLYDPDYDFDEMNDEIAELFGAHEARKGFRMKYKGDLIK